MFQWSTNATLGDELDAAPVNAAAVVRCDTTPRSDERSTPSTVSMPPTLESDVPNREMNEVRNRSHMPSRSAWLQEDASSLMQWNTMAHCAAPWCPFSEILARP